MPTPCSPRFAACSRLTLVAIGLLLAAPLTAQDGARSYDENALRVETSFWGSKLVRGSKAEKISGLGMFPGRIEVLEQSTDSVRKYYNSFRSSRKTGGGLAIGGLVLMIAGTLAGLEDAPGAAVFLGGIGVAIGGAVVAANAGDDLSRAVWWYNREFR